PALAFSTANFPRPGCALAKLLCLSTCKKIDPPSVLVFSLTHRVSRVPAEGPRLKGKENRMASRLLSVPVLALLLTSPGVADGPKKKEGDDIKISVVVPKDAPTLEAVNAGKATIKVRFENKGKKEVVLWSRVSLELQDANGKEVPPSLAIGTGPRDP